MKSVAAGTRTLGAPVTETVHTSRMVFFFALLAAGTLGTMPLSAQDQRVSLGVLGGVSFANQTAARSPGTYMPPPDLSTISNYTDSWTKLSASVYLDVIYAYLDFAVSGIVGPVATNSTQVVPPPQQMLTYEKNPEDYGVSRLSVDLDIGVKMPIALTDEITIFPLLGLDIVSQSGTNAPFFTSTFIPMLRIGAGADFRLDKQIYFRIMADYSTTVDFNFVDIKTGIGIKL